MAKSNILNELWVRLPNSKYPIIIGNKLFDEIKLLSSFIKTRNVMIITNKTIAPLYLAEITAQLTDFHCLSVILDDGESFKNHESLFQIYSTLINNNYHRDTTIIALGGGVIGDMAGFVASTYQRGVDFIQVPTTLLAQVDASVGGKTAVNFLHAKNSIGSFYQPSAVLIDTYFLNSLPAREFKAGLAEVIKYSILKGGAFYNYVEQALIKGLANNTNYQLAEIIYKCCQIKSSIIEADEREQNIRALLNLGHTVAHALEAYSNYTRWLHGEAVGIGLYAAALLSCRYYQVDESMVLSIDRLLVLADLPRRIPVDIDLDKLRLMMNQDKKIKDNHLTFILIKRIGECYRVANVKEADLHWVLSRTVE